MITTGPKQRAAFYSENFSGGVPLSATDSWLTGTWLIGSCYKNPNPIYGAYPHSYLDRVMSMFPEANQILHIFSGGLRAETLPSGRHHELVDIHGPSKGRYPTWQGDVLNLPDAWIGKFDLILADPPYSPADAEKYEVKMPDRKKVFESVRRVCRTGGNMVWLDQVWPMHRKSQWKCWGMIGLVRSTNHRVRLVSMFEAV